MSKQLGDNPGLARLIEKQMRNWELTRSQRPLTMVEGGEAVAPFLTIANIVGAGGNEIAVRIAERLGWPVFDRQILSTMAGDDDVRARLYASMDERDLGWCEEAFRSLMQQEFRKNDYFPRLGETILMLARRGSAIFVGRAADLILQPHVGLRVKIIASRQRCAENFAHNVETTVENARIEVNRIETERRSFIENHFHIEPHEPTRFDLMINIERFTTAQVVEIIMGALKVRGITPIAPSG